MKLRRTKQCTKFLGHPVCVRDMSSDRPTINVSFTLLIVRTHDCKHVWQNHFPYLSCTVLAGTKLQNSGGAPCTFGILQFRARK